MANEYEEMRDRVGFFLAASDISEALALLEEAFDDAEQLAAEVARDAKTYGVLNVAAEEKRSQLQGISNMLSDVQLMLETDKRERKARAARQR